MTTLYIKKVGGTSKKISDYSSGAKHGGGLVKVQLSKLTKKALSAFIVGSSRLFEGIKVTKMMRYPINLYARPPTAIGVLMYAFIWSLAVWFAVCLVAACAGYAQICATVISRVFVAMIYVFTEQQRPTDDALHDDPVHQQAPNLNTAAHKGIARSITSRIGHPFQIGKIGIFVIKQRHEAACQRYFDHRTSF